MDSSIRIEKAKPENARDIQNVYYRTWLATYPNTEAGITLEDIEDHFKDVFEPARVAKRAQKIANQASSEIFLLAKDGDMIAGLIRATRHEDHNQINTLYVLTEYQGKGIGSALWSEAEKFLDPHVETRVHVFTYNQRAIDFYAKRGFSDTGERFTRERFRFKSGSIMPEMLMVRKSQ